MCCSILGQHISLVRPALIKVPQKIKNSVKYRMKPKTIENCSVTGVLVKMKNGGIRGLSKGTHLGVIQAFGIDPDNVSATGWSLSNGKEIWR